MIKIMRHIEMHVIETPHELGLADQAGLDVFNEESCDNCLARVGEVEDAKFVPFVILLDDDSEWFICKECAEPVL